MQHIAWFAPEPVPEAVFVARPELLPEPLRTGAANEIDFDDLVSALRKLGLAERLTPSVDSEPGSAALRLHRLTRAVVRDLHSDAASVAPVVVALIDAASVDPRDPSTWSRWAALMPHVLDAALGEAAERAAPVTWARIRDAVGRYQLSAGSIKACADSFRASQALRKRLLGDEHPDTITSMNNLAESLSAQGDLAGARGLRERVLEARRRLLGEEHPDTTVSACNLFATLLQLDENDAAVAILTECLTWLLTADLDSLSADQRMVRGYLEHLGPIGKPMD